MGAVQSAEHVVNECWLHSFPDRSYEVHNAIPEILDCKVYVVFPFNFILNYVYISHLRIQNIPKL